ncbi:iron ABC transporter permease [Deferribacterales bacterium RsTz2092]|nr:iron ABC transporter permease [Deferribacterales bacterium]
MNKYIVLSVLLIVSVAFGVILGYTQLFPVTDETLPILLNFRIPRVLFALLNGVALSLAGLVYQIILRNPMADGFTTGAASSAAFGGCLALILWGAPHIVAISAFLSALISAVIVWRLAKRSDNITVILAGITISVIASSGVSFLKYFYDDAINTMVFWLMGSVANAGWNEIAIMGVLAATVLVGLFTSKDKIAVLFLDDESAATSGVDVYKLRLALFVITTFLVAISVSFCGTIGFIGLMVPHAVRMLFGHTIREQLVCSAMLGGLVLVVLDIISRTVLSSGAELPIGVITSFCGGLFFALLLLKRGGRVWS